VGGGTYTGGAGLANTITGSSAYYGGGGGGGSSGGTPMAGGLGGGGAGGFSGGASGGAGAANTGGGGGGSATSTAGSGGAGGSGVVIVRYPLPAATLTLWEGDGTTVLRTTKHTSTIPAAGQRDVVIEVRTGGTSGALVAKTKYHYVNQAWGEELDSVIADPDGAALTTTYAYHSNSANAGNYRKVKSVTAPAGGWTAWEYYDDWDKRGQLKYQFQPYLDAPATAAGASATTGRATYFEYAADWTGRHARPALREERVNNVLTAKSTWTHGDTTGSGEPRAHATVRSYRDASNYHEDYAEHYRADADPDFAGQPYLAKAANQAQAATGVSRGTFNTSTKAFTVSSTGDHWREVRLHGSTNGAGADMVSSFDGQGVPTSYALPNKSTVDVIIRIAQGYVYRTETWVYTGSGAFALLTAEDFDYDATGHLTQRWASTGNGALTAFTWTNGRLTSTTGVDGAETQFTYDALGRVATTVKKGASSLSSALTTGYNYPAQGDITTTNTYDGASRVTQAVVSGGALSLTSSAAFDLAGRPTSQSAPGGYVTSFAYANGGRTVTTTLPTASTRITDAFLDGSPKSVTGTGVVAEHFAPAILSGGVRELVHRQVSTTGPVVATTQSDWLGRPVLRTTPSPSGSGTTDQNWHYNSSGQLWKITRTGANPTLLAYDTLGAKVREGLDANNNGALDLASDDRIADFGYTFFESSGWWRRDTTGTYAVSGSSTATQVAKAETQLNGLPANRLARADTTDIFGNVTSATTDVERSNKRVTTTTDTPDSTTNTVRVAHNGLGVETQDFTGLRHRAEYDALGRPWKSIDPRTGTTTTTYVAGTSLVSTVTDPASVVTATYAYDSAGRVSWAKDALNKYAYTSYTARSEIWRTWGDTAYPVEYAYDDQGRKSTMKTYRGGSGWNASTWPASPGTADTTTWNYHAPTGLVTSKTDASNKAVAFTYTTAGQIYQRTWARGVVTTYAYSAVTGEQTGVTYSDGTPSLSATYNRQGLKSSIGDVTGTRTLEYCDCGKPLYEVLPSGFYGNRKVNWKIDATTTGALGRSYGVSVSENNVAEYDLTYGFDASGRLNAAGNFNYAYTANSHLVASVAQSASGWAQYRTYLTNANALDIIETKFSTVTKAKFDHTHDALYRVVTVAKTGDQFSSYGNGTQGLETDFAYDDRSQLTADSTALGGSSTPLTGRDDYHAYDPIGNRTSVNRSGTTLTYTANNLNQYTAITGSSAPTYDDDGNITGDGLWNYTWDAENRLVTQENVSSASPRTRLENKYDHRNRRVRTTVSTWSGSAWVVNEDLKFIYDGANMLLELDALASNAKARAHTWGLDLSGSRQGAGGVGGLLTTYHYATAKTLLPVYDGNGNITGYLDYTGGGWLMKNEYDAFGQTVVSSGSHAALAPFKFSTKYQHAASGHYDYGRRHYDPKHARFHGRDPIGEQGGLNLYAFVRNNPISYIDYLGMDLVGIDMTRSFDNVVTLPPFVVTATSLAPLDRLFADLLRNMGNYITGQHVIDMRGDGGGGGELVIDLTPTPTPTPDPEPDKTPDDVVKLDPVVVTASPVPTVPVVRAAPPVTTPQPITRGEVRFTIPNPHTARWDEKKCAELWNQIQRDNRRFQVYSRDLNDLLDFQRDANNTLFLVDRARDLAIALAAGQVAHGISAIRAAMQTAPSMSAVLLASSGTIQLGTRPLIDRAAAYASGPLVDHALAHVGVDGAAHPFPSGSGAVHRVIQNTINSLESQAQGLGKTLQNNRDEYRNHCN
jgi:RHS repeat-associated protein